MSTVRVVLSSCFGRRSRACANANPHAIACIRYRMHARPSVLHAALGMAMLRHRACMRPRGCASACACVCTRA
eukprot:273859-Pleurochrysis_carterae.AAC.1